MAKSPPNNGLHATPTAGHYYENRLAWVGWFLINRALRSRETGALEGLFFRNVIF
jgi:hypothetical protein